MSPSTTSAARAEAIDAVAWYIAQRDRTTPTDRADAEVEAAAVVQALWARGWRPIATQAAPPWMPSTGRPAAPDAVHRHAQAARAALTRQENPTDG
ncbi:hypothetical protein ACF07Q_28695 [Nocardiopsis dassonvillei]|uniref:hypothetical protein n=1 Tax=Nocardiopsis dassonvillei TaxID=2014 RepID=UPI0036F9D150